MARDNKYNVRQKIGVATTGLAMLLGVAGCGGTGLGQYDPTYNKCSRLVYKEGSSNEKVGSRYTDPDKTENMRQSCCYLWGMGCEGDESRIDPMNGSGSGGNNGGGSSGGGSQGGRGGGSGHN